MNTRKSIYGRRQGRPLSKERRDALDVGLTKYQIPAPLLTQDSKLNPTELFNLSPQQIWLEIGFGSGEHLLELSQKHTTYAYLGAEPFINGMSYFLKHYERSSAGNVRVLMDDGMILAKSLSSRSIDGIYILNPDPWPKTRHHKRRIINADNLAIFSDILKPSGQLVLSTDVPDLAEWMVTKTINCKEFKWTAKSKNDWLVPPEDWISTKYEQKNAKGAQVMTYLFFQKV
jgi:tRNA (guanine-N7-)-methyltransferase